MNILTPHNYLESKYYAHLTDEQIEVGQPVQSHRTANGEASMGPWESYSRGML